MYSCDFCIFRPNFYVYSIIFFFFFFLSNRHKFCLYFFFFCIFPEVLHSTKYSSTGLARCCCLSCLCRPLARIFEFIFCRLIDFPVSLIKLYARGILKFYFGAVALCPYIYICSLIFLAICLLAYNFYFFRYFLHKIKAVCRTLILSWPFFMTLKRT